MRARDLTTGRPERPRRLALCNQIARTPVMGCALGSASCWNGLPADSPVSRRPDLADGGWIETLSDRLVLSDGVTGADSDF